MTYFSKTSERKIVAAVEEAVEKITGVTPETLRYRVRDRKTTRARFLAWSILKLKFNWGISEIAEIYGRDHATVTHGLKKARELGIDEDAKLVEINSLSTCST